MITTRSVEYAKEVDDFMVFLVGLVKVAKAGQPITNELGSLLNVLAGLSQLSEELKNSKVVEETVGYRLGDLVFALTGGA